MQESILTPEIENQLQKHPFYYNKVGYDDYSIQFGETFLGRNTEDTLAAVIDLNLKITQYCD